MRLLKMDEIEMKTDKEILQDILTGAFKESDRIKAIMRKGKTEKRLRIMAAYGYELCKDFDGVFLSEDKSTAILYWRKSQFRRSFVTKLKYLSMFFRTVRMNKVISTMKREKLVESHRLTVSDYIYVWILGSDPTRTSIRGLADVRDHLNGLSTKYNLPVLMETTVEKLLRFYKYSGYEIYDEIFDVTTDLPVWFLKKDVPV